MKTQWDYTHLAKAYLKRPDYSADAINHIFNISGVQAGQKACDIGAGVAHLTLHLAAKGLLVDAVEPNDAMRALGIRRTSDLPNVQWFEGTGEETGRPSDTYHLVSFGSSFNVTDREKALAETSRLLKPGGWFTCMWNHRKLDDPIQTKIELIIHDAVPEYAYGTRRSDQQEVIEASKLFRSVEKVEGSVLHQQSVVDCIEAWRSHATLQRQAGDAFQSVVEEIAAYLESLRIDTIEIPYTTRAWVAQRA